MRELKERAANNMFHRECDIYIYSKSLKFRSFKIIILPFSTSRDFEGFPLMNNSSLYPGPERRMLCSGHIMG